MFYLLKTSICKLVQFLKKKIFVSYLQTLLFIQFVSQWHSLPIMYLSKQKNIAIDLNVQLPLFSFHLTFLWILICHSCSCPILYVNYYACSILFTSSLLLSSKWAIILYLLAKIEQNNILKWFQRLSVWKHSTYILSRSCTLYIGE